MRNLKITKLVTNRDAASLDLYLRDIGKERLISVDEEAYLAQKIKEGDPKAFERLIKANLRFVISIAKQYQTQGIPITDLINEGNLGLIKAAEHYDETRGFKFISYAVWWIRQSIMQAIAEQSRIVRLPMNKIGSLSKISKASKKLEQDFQREPIPNEIAEMLELRVLIVEEALQICNFQVSADAPLYESEGDNITLYDTLINGDSPSPDMPLINHSLKIEIERTLGTLSEREAAILRYYFGLIGENALSIDEIAKILGITPQGVLQIKKKALKKLKNIHKNQRLRAFLG
jgi:RNA polymerase primary sigma factor